MLGGRALYARGAGAKRNLGNNGASSGPSRYPAAVRMEATCIKHLATCLYTLHTGSMALMTTFIVMDKFFGNLRFKKA